MTTYLPSPRSATLSRIAEELRSQEAVYAAVASNVSEWTNKARECTETHLPAVGNSPRLQVLRLAAGASAARQTIVVSTLDAVRQILMRLAYRADETAEELRRAEMRAEEGAHQPYEPPEPRTPVASPPNRVFDPLVADAVATWLQASARAADEIAQLVNTLRAPGPEAQSRSFLESLTRFVADSVASAPPVDVRVVESWIVTVTRRGEFGVGGGIEDVFEVRRLDNGRFEVLHRSTGSIYVEGGVEAAGGVRLGERDIAIDGTATAMSRVEVDHETTFAARDLDEVKMLITQSVLRSAGFDKRAMESSGGLLGTLGLAAQTPINKGALGWLSDRGEDAGLPDLWEAYNYEGTLAETYVGVGSTIEGRLAANIGGYAEHRMGAEGTISRSWGKLTRGALTGDRVVLSGSALAELRAPHLSGADWGSNTTVQVDWLDESGSDRLMSVTAVVTTFDSNSVTTRTTTFDLATDEGRSAARKVTDAARAPVGGTHFRTIAPDALVIVTGDGVPAGVEADEQTFSVSSGDYGVFADLSIGADFGVEFNVNVTHLE